MPRLRSCLFFLRPSASCWLAVLALAWLCGVTPSALAVAPPADTDKPLTSLLRLPKVAHPVRYAADLQLVPTADSFTGRIDIDLQIDEPTQVLWLDYGVFGGEGEGAPPALLTEELDAWATFARDWLGREIDVKNVRVVVWV